VLVKTVEQLKKKIDEIKKAQEVFSKFDQKHVDEIFRQAAIAANNSRIDLAKLAFEETKMGNVEDKVIKNHFASEYIYNKFKDKKTCGVIKKEDSSGLLKFADPIGVIAAVIPATNPTSTTILKILLALKTRNGIVLLPQSRAKKATIKAGQIILDAAVKAGAPNDIIGWIDEPSFELTQVVMDSSDFILSTGEPGMAYSSGKSAIGIGAGNTPAIVDETADIKMTVNSILLSKRFDNGMICTSEQSVLVHESIYNDLKKEFLLRGAYILSDKETDAMRKVIWKDGQLNIDIVGQSASKIASIAGIKVDKKTKILIGEISSVEFSEPFSHGKLSPILAMYKTKSFEEALSKAEHLVKLGASGHTSILYIDQMKSKEKIELFATTMKTGRTVINMPSSHGAVGDIYNSKLAPSLMFGYGSWDGNIVCENIDVKHLMNIKHIAKTEEILS